MVYKKYIKRALDILVAIIGLIVVSPVLLITAIIIKLDSPGPVIFKQERIGMDKKVFNIYKFRSMCVGAEKKSGGVYCKQGDPRVTRIGAFIRATSIDELPQFVNILKGEMSIIGPRPVLTYHPWTIDQYTEEQLKRFTVRPGVTGLAQINGRKELEWTRRIIYDVDYAENCSFLADMRIFFITFVKVFRNENNLNVSDDVEKLVVEAEESVMNQ